MDITRQKLNSIIDSQDKNLLELAKCHQSAFPHSFTSKMGRNYTAKTLEWYLTSDNKFLFHIEENGRIAGYCGGFVRMGEPYGSSSGMTQYAFREGLKALLVRPWLLFHPKIQGNFSFILRNIRYRFFPPRNLIAPGVQSAEIQPKAKTAGLVVIGVHPDFQGKGYGSMLLQEFERKARSMNCQKMGLTVEAGNDQAIRSYTRNGWQVISRKNDHLEMEKVM